jgi:membrane-associated phospholipid phosphatase
MALVPMVVEVAARACLPLRDGWFVRMDQALSVSVPAITAWSNAHRSGRLISSTYPLLLWVLPVALVLPVVFGRAKVAREFVLANAIAFAIGLPLFALLPAVGPWYGFHTAGLPVQLALQNELLALRGSSSHPFQLAGVICFPSFHVIWAILVARALWAFRWLRWPAVALCSLIALSTLTTGWHYFADVLAGGLLAVFAIACSDAIACSATTSAP